MRKYVYKQLAFLKKMSKQTFSSIYPSINRVRAKASRRIYELGLFKCPHMNDSLFYTDPTILLKPTLCAQ